MPDTSFNHRPRRAWLKIEINSPAIMTDSIAGFLAELTESGVEVSTQAVDAPKPASRETVTGYLADDEKRADNEQAVADFLKQLTRQFPGSAMPVFNTSLIQEEDWGENWKKHFKPIKITPRVTIKPSWEEYTPADDEIVIEMDPGMAFGTGHHASTRLALEFIDKYYDADATRPQRVLDVGTGTGVLGLACALFGATEVIGIDNDPDAVAAAQENVDHNRLVEKMTVSGLDLAKVQGSFELVIANITSNVLIEMSALLYEHMAPTAGLILAGILKGEQENAILKAFTAIGLRHLATNYRDEWASLHFTRD